MPLGHLCLTHRIYFKHYFETLVNERGDAATERRERERQRQRQREHRLARECADNAVLLG